MDYRDLSERGEYTLPRFLVEDDLMNDDEEEGVDPDDDEEEGFDFYPDDEDEE